MKISNLDRRSFLRASGVALGLPLFEAAFGRTPEEAPQRMVVVLATMGLVPWNFFPKKAGRDYESTPYLDLLKAHRSKMTVFSGVSHPEVDGGHHADRCFLTGAPHPGSSGFRNTISLDQYAAARIGHLTRVPALNLHSGSEGRKSPLAWTASGVNLPAQDKPSEVYKRLFMGGSPKEIEERLEELRHGRSLLDAVRDRARGLGKELGASDRRKLDEYLTGIRDLEKRMVAAEAWEKTPKPKVKASMPKDVQDRSDIVGMARLMYQMARLAIETDSTRIITIAVHAYGNVKIEGVTQGHHPLTHHGKRPEALKQLRLIEEARLGEFRDFLTSLSETREKGASLLDRTMVLYGTHMGDANRHSNDNLPVLLAGGGFRHGAHRAFSREHNTPLANLFVTMLRRLGIEADRFASSTGTLTI